MFVSPETTRTAFAEEAGTAVLAVGATRGKAYEPSGWEVWAPAHPRYEAGDYAGAVEKAREIVEAKPGYAAPLYNLACCEALTGRTEDAIGHLRAANRAPTQPPRPHERGHRPRPDPGRARLPRAHTGLTVAVKNSSRQPREQK